MTDEKKESDIIKLLKMIHDALFSPSPHDDLYKPSKLIPGMVFYYLITIIVVIVVIYLALRSIGFDWSSLGF
ncbi:MAG: hypothetical protein O8C68_02515 [Candidatus Methanoperedens sp.]|nr:hypothetical protein [Candidatus Methanoperedens sp.]MCZ7394676.1 hypothetical protein [Candidatus Methanoperedens sp.]